MADWFKFHNDELDSKAMQFAISEQPLVTSALLVILSEASKARSKRVSWHDEDFELIGYARKINISVPIMNQCIGLLERCGIIKRGAGFIEVVGWNDKQSNYAKGVDKGYYAGRKTNKRLTSNSLVSTTRREEKRVEENIPSIAVGGEHKAFIEGWVSNFKVAFQVDYKFEAGRDGKAVKELLSMGILRIDLLEIAKSAWSKQAFFACRQAQTIHGFKQYFNNIQVEIKNGTSTANSRTPPQRVDRSIGTANEGKASLYKGLGGLVGRPDPSRPTT